MRAQRGASYVFGREERVTDKSVRDVIIIGGGPAGYTAALYSARANLDPLAIEGFSWGGQLMITSDVENYPGYPDGVLGPAMMQEFRRQADRFGTEFVSDDVTASTSRASAPRLGRRRRIPGRGGDHRHGRVARQLGLESEQKLQGAASPTAPYATRPSSRTRTSSSSAAATRRWRRLSSWRSSQTKVTVVHRREAFRASPIMVDRARANEKVEFVLDSVVEEIRDTEQVASRAWSIRNLKTDETTELPADGIFVAIGHDPSTELFKGQHRDGRRRLHPDEGKTTETNVPGVFAAGDVQDHVYRQAVTAAGSGCQAALDAERFLAAQEGGAPEEPLRRGRRPRHAHELVARRRRAATCLDVERRATGALLRARLESGWWGLGCPGRNPADRDKSSLAMPFPGLGPLGSIARVPYFICPHCRRRSVDHDRREGLTERAVGCPHCGFGFLFELLDDYYPAPGTGFVVCDRECRVIATGQGVFELTGFREAGRHRPGRDGGFRDRTGTSRTRPTWRWNGACGSSTSMSP